MTVIDTARFPEHVAVVREIFREYAGSLALDLGFQDFSTELAQLPGKYSAPGGAVLLAWHGDDVVGCVAFRPVDTRICEMKRLYVRTRGRGTGLGKRLAQEALQRARRCGYERMRLDTLPTMHAAHELYGRMGFTPIDAYVFNPVPGTRYMELDLADGPGELPYASPLTGDCHS